MSPADAATEILDGFENGEEEIYVGDMARGLAEGLAKDPKASSVNWRRQTNVFASMNRKIENKETIMIKSGVFLRPSSR